MDHVYTLKFTDAEMQVITGALVELPFKVAAPLINNINAQVRASMDVAKNSGPTTDAPVPAPAPASLQSALP